jgi:hypothetical protein
MWFIASLFTLSSIMPIPAAGPVNGCLQPPVTGRVVAPFVAPACPFCAGHRTIDFSSVLGEAVVSPVAGTVTFYGFVAGRLYVTIDPTDSTTFAPGTVVTVGGLLLDDVSAEGPNPRRGDPVRQGERVGDAGGWPISLSVRRSRPDGAYLDPGPLLGRWRSVARLVPRNGPGRTVSSVLTCPVGSNSR